MKRKKLPKERNPFVQHLINKRGGGVHQKSKKAQRRDDKIELRKGNKTQDDFDKGGLSQNRLTSGGEIGRRSGIEAVELQ